MQMGLKKRITNLFERISAGYLPDIVQIFFMVVWPVLLLGSKSYPSIYVICSMAAVFAFAVNRRNCGRESKLVRIVTILFSCLFSVLVTLANYELFHPLSEKWLETACVLIGGFVVAEQVLLLLYRRLPEATVKTEKTPVYQSVAVFVVTFFALSAIYLLYLYFSAYPGMLTYDSVDQIKQALHGITSNHHPFWHTIIIKGVLKVGLRLFGDINAAIALYSVCQLMFLAGAVAFSLMTLYTAGVKKLYIFMCGLPFAVLPYHIVYSVTMWKDVVFGVATLLFVVFFFRSLNRIGNQVINLVFLFFFAVLFGLWRSNAWLALVGSAVLFLFFLRKEHKKILLVVAAAVLVSWVMRSPVLSALDVKQPDFVESLSIPVQQVARVVVDDGYISEEDRQTLNKIMDVDEVKDLYLDYLSDPIKNEIRSKGHDYLDENKIEFFKLWVRVGIHNPWSYISAWVDQTKGYYNSGYKYWITATYSSSDEIGFVKKTFDNPINDHFTDALDDMNQHALAKPFISIGFCVWIFAALGITLFLRRRKEFVLMIPLALTVGTLLIATPVFSEFRYVYFLFTTMPFLITAGMHRFEKNKGEQKDG